MALPLNERRKKCLEQYKSAGPKLTGAGWRRTLADKYDTHVSVNTAYADLEWAKKKFVGEFSQDEFFIDQVNFLVGRLENWDHINPNVVIGGLKLLSEWFDFPTNIQRIINRDENKTVSITTEEYDEYLKLRAKESEDGN